MDLLSLGVGFIFGILVYAIFTSTIKTTEKNTKFIQEEPTVPAIKASKPAAKRGRKPKTVEAKLTTTKKTK